MSSHVISITVLAKGVDDTQTFGTTLCSEQQLEANKLEEERKELNMFVWV